MNREYLNAQRNYRETLATLSGCTIAHNPTGGSWKLTEAGEWRIPDDDEECFEFRTVGPWQIPVSMRGLAVEFKDYNGVGRHIAGYRTMHDLKDGGYCTVGRISVDGYKCRAFTSSMLFEREDGSLCKVAVLFFSYPDVEIEDDDE